MKRIATIRQTNIKNQRKTVSRLKDNSRGVPVSILRHGKSKYNNKRTECDGIVFDSLRELARYKELKLLLRAGEIMDLTVHEPFILQLAFKDFEGKKHRPISYEADFYYFDIARKSYVAEDVKASKTFQTEVYRIKKKLFLYSYQDIQFHEIY